MAHSEVLISELVAVDGLTSISVEILQVSPQLFRPYGDVSSLEHEVGDDSVEDGVLVAQINTRLALSLLSSAQASEVLGGLGDDIVVQLDAQPSAIELTSKTILPAG